ncbi:unnamed protein product [Sympodiomycopsis kandeliae]
MYFDLNIPFPGPVFNTDNASAGPSTANNKNKQQQQKQPPPQVVRNGDEVDPLKKLSNAQRDQVRLRAEDLNRMGYSVIAFNHIVTSRLDPSIHHNPFSNVRDTLPDGSLSTSTSLVPTASRPVFPSLPSLTQLQRLTLILDAASEGKSGMASGLGPGASNLCLQSYDLLAVQPTTSNTFTTTCLTHTELKPTGPSFDIVSLDLSSTPRLPFHLKRSTIGKVLENGAVFEITYSPALPGHNQEIRLRNLISNTRDLLRITNGGKGLILSSAASTIMGLRNPTDVMNLATLFGFSSSLARDAVSDTCSRLWKRAQSRRSFRAVVGVPMQIVDPQVGVEEVVQNGTDPRAKPQEIQQGKKRSQQQQQQKQKQNKKQKKQHQPQST